MTEEPIVRTFTSYKCPRCHQFFVSREDFDRHACSCSPELVDRAESLVGEWVVVARDGRTVVGTVTEACGAEVVIEGFVATYHGSIIHFAWYDETWVHVSDVRDASNPRNAMLILDSLVSAGIRDRFVARFPEAGGEDE